MDTITERLPGMTDVDRDELAREFETRLFESSTLTFRVAYGVLRHQEDAEDVAQEAFAKAYRKLQPAQGSRPLPCLARADDLAPGPGPPARGASPHDAGHRARERCADDSGGQ